MAHDVFICYSARDRTTANAVCAVLEQEGIRCWIAPRNISPGADYGESIIDGINNARALVLVFSSNANASQSQIKREVERAVHKDIPVIPFRIEDVLPTKALEYFLSTPHWLDAFTPPLEHHMPVLVDAVRRQLGGADSPRAATNLNQPTATSASPTAGQRPTPAPQSAFAMSSAAATPDGGGTAVAVSPAAMLLGTPRSGALDAMMDQWWRDRSRRSSAILLIGLLVVAILGGAWFMLRGTAAPEDRAAWETAERADSIPAYEMYLKAFPDGYFAGKARAQESQTRSRIIAAWIRTKQSGTPAAYREFIAEWEKHGMFVDEAKVAIARDEEQKREARERVTAIQDKLVSAGLYSGTVDGNMSPATISAIKALQLSASLPQTGVFDSATSQAADAAVAKNKETHDAYLAAMAAHTRATYTSFIAKYPNSSDVADVRQRLAACHMQTKTQLTATADSLPRTATGQGGDAQSACAQARSLANNDGSSACLAGGGRVGGLQVSSETPRQDVAASVAKNFFDTLLNRTSAAPTAHYTCVSNISVECVHSANTATQVEACP